MLTLITLATLTFQAPVTNEPPSVLRGYDVRLMLPGRGSVDSELVLLPLSRDYGDTYPSFVLREVERHASLVQSFVRALDPAQWEYENRQLDVIGDSELRVLAPQALQDVVARSLMFLEDTLGRPTTLVVDIVGFGPNPGISTLPPLLPASEVARWTAIGTGHESYEFSLVPGTTGVQRAERSVSFAIDADPDIAEHAVGFVMRPELLAVGTVIQICTAPAKSGSWVALSMRNGRFVDVESTRDAVLHGAITHDQGVANSDTQKLRSDPRVVNHSLALNTFVPEGKALAFVTSAGLESRVVFVRQVGTIAPLSANLPDELKRVTSRSASALARIDSLHLPTARISNRDGQAILESLDLVCRPAADAGEFSDPCLKSFITHQPSIDVTDLLKSLTDDYETIEMGAFVAILGASRESIDKALAKIEQLAPTPHACAVTLTLRRGTRDGAVLARAVLPIRAGATSTVVAGRESVADLAGSAEVVQGAAAFDTIVGRIFDGMTVSITPTATLAGGWVFEFDAHARWSRTQPREFDSGGTNSPSVQLPDADLLDVVRSVSFAKNEAGPRKVTLGNAGASSEALTLDIEVVDLR
ncbi:MAG: hypothetical protein SGI72_09915 [Planctomycetota bacterium]|nr:hypothetical protein [Planctomycetota bacterium]